LYKNQQIAMRQKIVGINSAFKVLHAFAWRTLEGKTMNAINVNIHTGEQTSSYHAIRKLMENALFYMQQAADAFDAGSGQGWCNAIIKAHGYILGLRASLDLENGGSIADNLDGLYDYMLIKLNKAFEDVDVDALSEVYSLLEEVKSGWDGIELFAADVEEAAVSA